MDNIKKQAVDCILKQMGLLEVSVSDILKAQQSIGIVWNIDDVQAIIEWNHYEFEPALTDEEKFEVLDFSARHHDAEYGINWSTLEGALLLMFQSRLKK